MTENLHASSHPSVSVVIPTFNRKNSLHRALESLFKQSVPSESYEIVVIIDGSIDGTEEMLESLKPSCALRWFAQENQGPPAACNLGIREAKGDLILFLPDDNLASPELVEEHLKSHDVAGNKVVIGAVHLADEQEAFSPLQQGHAGYDEYYRRVAENRLKLPHDASVAQNTSVRREHLLAVGGFDETFRFMHEDNELGFRLYKKGFRFESNPRAIVKHRLAKKEGEVLDKEAFLNGRNSVLLMRKHPEFRATYNIGPTFFSGNWMKRRTKQTLLSCRLHARVWHFAAHAAYAAASVLRLPARIRQIAAGQIYFLRYCDGVRAAGCDLKELRNTFKRSVPILFYHSVCETDEPTMRYLAVNPRSFERQMMYLRKRGYETISLTTWFDWLERAVPLPRKPVILTFDDGYRDNFEHAFPIMKKFGFTGTVFVVTDIIGKTNEWDRVRGAPEMKMLGADEIRTMESEGFEFGSHGKTHTSLTGLGSEQARQELAESRQALSHLIGKSVHFFAYPNGDLTKDAEKFVKEAGYRGACSVAEGVSDLYDRPYALKRLDVTGRHNMLAFRLMIWFGKDVAAKLWRKFVMTDGEKDSELEHAY